MHHTRNVHTFTFCYTSVYDNFSVRVDNRKVNLHNPEQSPLMGNVWISRRWQKRCSASFSISLFNWLHLSFLTVVLKAVGRDWIVLLINEKDIKVAGLRLDKKDFNSNTIYTILKQLRT